VPRATTKDRRRRCADQAHIAANRKGKHVKQVATTFFFQAIGVICCFALPMTAGAAGLSPIKVNSALGQPFLAEIEITGLPSEEFEFELAKGRVAGPEAYEDAKLVYPPLVRQFRMSTERRADGKPILKVVSSAPINEPALNLLVEFNWRGGRLTQKYSILFDPPN
jgi:pilus assembly protein FimV